MTEEKYIWCRNCNEVHHVSRFDTAPMYIIAQGEEREVPMDDRRAFADRHANHKLEALAAVGEKYLRAGELVDPMDVAYIEVTNGQEWFVIRRFRRRIENRLTFELVSGSITVSHG